MAISRIRSADLSILQSTLLTGKRCKRVHLFDSTGQSTLARSHAAFMVDGSMTPIELANWDMVQRWGLRVPTIFGETDQGIPIVEWLPQQLTVGGGGRFHVFAELKNVMRPGSLTGGFQRDKLMKTLEDIRQLVRIGYSSPDLQFMISADGRVFIMDLEQNNTPVRIRGRRDPRLEALERFLASSLEGGRAADLRQS